jgi:hypothetical protein
MGSNMPDDKTLLDLHKTLDDSIWISKHCRFIAANRLSKRYLFSQFTVALLSVFCIFLSLADKFLPIFNAIANYVSFLNVLLSVFIIVLSLFEASANHNGHSDRLYACANNAAGLLLKLKSVDLSVPNAMAELKAISSEYSNLISQYQENQENYDYNLFKSQAHKHFKTNLLKRLQYKSVYFVLSYGFYVLLIALPIIALWFMCSKLPC